MSPGESLGRGAAAGECRGHRPRLGSRGSSPKRWCRVRTLQVRCRNWMVLPMLMSSGRTTRVASVAAASAGLLGIESGTSASPKLSLAWPPHRRPGAAAVQAGPTVGPIYCLPIQRRPRPEQFRRTIPLLVCKVKVWPGTIPDIDLLAPLFYFGHAVFPQETHVLNTRGTLLTPHPGAGQ
ncbi:hypothetical protein NKDENANG_02961 [Candidatus Entotheonellaceae bacterium PAL068K]